LRKKFGLGATIPRDYTFDSDNLIGRDKLAMLVIRKLDGGREVNQVNRARPDAIQKTLGV
jgi:hypothetical protein